MGFDIFERSKFITKGGYTLLSDSMRIEGELARSNAEHVIKGYLFQFDRALSILSGFECETDSVAVELLDDVFAVRDLNGAQEIILEQDKMYTSTNKPYADNAKGLWRSLENWLDFIERQDVSQNNQFRFVLATNQIVDGKQWVSNFLSTGKRKQSVKSLCDKLKACGDAISSNSEIKRTAQKVCSTDIKRLKFLIQRLEVVDGNDETIRDDDGYLMRRLCIGSHIPSTVFLREIRSWFVAEWLDRNSSDNSKLISKKELVEESNKLVARYLKKPFIEKAKDLMPNEDQVLNSQNSTFVRQIQLIEGNDEDILGAIHDYFRAAADRNNHAHECSFVSHKDYDDFDQNLFERWKHYRRLMDLNSEYQNRSLVNLGMTLYLDVTFHKERLAGYETEHFYTTKGNFHRLADIKRIGWHPSWKELL